MATWFVLNTVAVVIVPSSPVRVFPSGETVDDTQVPTAPIIAAGGQIWPTSDPVVAAAAAIAVAGRKNKGFNEAQCDSIMSAAAHASAQGRLPIRLSIAVPLATIIAQTSGTAFNIGSPLPANVRVDSVELVVGTTLSGGSATAAHATVQGGSDSAGSLIASTDVFTATGTFATPGTNPYATRGGQQLKMTITGDGTHALSTLTAGSMTVNVFYYVIP